MPPVNKGKNKDLKHDWHNIKTICTALNTQENTKRHEEFIIEGIIEIFKGQMSGRNSYISAIYILYNSWRELNTLKMSCVL